MLGTAVVGRYKSGNLPKPSRVGGCAVEVPYQAGLRATALYAERRRRRAPATLLHFAGAIDVCCSVAPPPQPRSPPQPPARLTCYRAHCAQGKLIRCAVGRLAVDVARKRITDVLIHPSIPSNRSLWGECLNRTMAGLRFVRRVQDAAKRRADAKARGRRLQATWPSDADLPADDLRSRIPKDQLWRFNAVNSSRVAAGAPQPQPQAQPQTQPQPQPLAQP